MLTRANARAECTRLTSERAAAQVKQRLGRGVNSLPYFAGTATLVGVVGGIMGIIYSFLGVVGERSTIYFATMDSLSRALYPIELGLAVALQALWTYKYLTGQIEALDHDMRVATLELANQFALYKHS